MRPNFRVVSIASIPAPLRLAGLAALLLLAAFLAFDSTHRSAYALTFTVNSTADAVDDNPGNGICHTSAGTCTLRAAIQEANSFAGPHTITLPSGTYTLTITGAGENAAATGDLDVTGSLTINGAGAGATIIDANTLDRAVHAQPGSSVTLYGLTIRNGRVTGTSDNGGAVLNEGTTVDISHSAFNNNQANGALSIGGAVHGTGSSSTNIAHSTFDNNSVGAWGGGAVSTSGSATLTVFASTFTSNSGGAGGGAIYPSGPTTTITSSTFVANTSGSGGAIHSNSASVTIANSTFYNNTGTNGGAIDNRVGTMTITNSTLVLNTAPGVGDSVQNQDAQGAVTTVRNSILSGATTDNCSGTITDGGNNLRWPSGFNTCPGSSGDPLVGALADNGGPTQTFALLPGSPAIDAGNTATCAAAPVNSVDQRGVHRPIDGDANGTANCDIGAYELGFVVNQVLDDPDANTSDGKCETVGGSCTLRAAIEQANATAGTDSIVFSIGTGLQTISPATALPAITSPVIIDGATQPGATCGGAGFAGRSLLIELAAGPALVVNGLELATGSGGSTIKGLVVRGFSSVGAAGIRVDSGSSGNTIACNNIGTNTAGTAAAANARGVHAAGSSNHIGGPDTGDGNIVSGNTEYGIYLDNAANGNVIDGNYIGLNAAGTGAIGNGKGIQLAGANSTVIGGTTSGARNVISGNSGVAVDILGSSNEVKGNYIGTNAAGTLALQNAGGVFIFSGSGNVVGGSTAGERNIISGHGVGDGVRLEGASTTGNTVKGNFIGLNAAGTTAVPNLAGVRLSSAPGNTIGGTSAAQRNVISGNTNWGILLVGGGANSNTVIGNFIGPSASGGPGVGNGNGLSFQASTTGTQVGGTLAGQANVIAYNVSDGVQILAQVVSVLGNSIHSNGSWAIDNNLVGPGPTLFGASAGAAVGGGMTGSAGTTYRIELFASVNCSFITRGGEVFLGSTSVVGGASFSITPSTPTTAGQWLTATATAMSPTAGSTSEFSFCQQVLPPSTPTPTPTSTPTPTPTPTPPAGPQTYIVTTTADSGSGTLRQAILDANAHAGTDTIVFNISGTGPFTITTLAAGLPTVTGPVVLDGYSQAGATQNTAPAGWNAATLVLIRNGGNAGANGLFFNSAASGSTVRGLDIAGYGGANIVISGATNVHAWGNVVGASATGNGNGVLISGASNTIGGPAAAERNIISGNTGAGVYLLNPAASGNLVQGNYIGTDATGTIALANGAQGVYLSSAGTGNVLRGNVISGNTTFGVFVGSTTGTTIVGNRVGTNAAGTAALPNLSNAGIRVFNSPGTVVGGTTGITPGGPCTGDCNLVSGNAVKGIFIGIGGAAGVIVQNNFVGTDVNGTADLGNGTDGITVDSPDNVIIEGNLVSGNGDDGISSETTGATLLVIRGNRIGTNAAGTGVLANLTGVEVGATTGATIGGTLAEFANVISGNGGAGIRLNGATGTTIQGNRIGTNATGTGALANAGSGIWLEVSTNTQIGGFGAAARNIVSGNGGQGVLVDGATNTGVAIQGNYIGLGADGTTSVSNTLNGVAVVNAPSVLIGGPAAAYGNVISGNTANGIEVNGAGATGTVIQGNYIGTDATGLLDKGNAGFGLYVINGAATSNIVVNVVSGNGSSPTASPGIAFVNAGSTHAVRGNRIGVGGDGSTALGNTGAGVWVENTSHVTIGGTGAGAGNTIANNGGAGAATSGTSTHTVITENSIFSNTGDGIAHTAAGITPAPVLTGAIAGSGSISGTLSPGANNTTFRIHYYASASCADPEGRSYLGFQDVSTDNYGTASVDVMLNTTLAAGEGVTATATDTTNAMTSPGSTSAFSNCVAAAGESAETVIAGFTTTTPTVPPAAYAVPIASIPVLSLTSLPRLLASAPLDSVTIKGTPLDSVPLDSVPLDSVQINGVPLDSVPLDSVPLDSVPLDSVPLDSVSWANYLVGTPLEGLPTNNLTLADLEQWAPAKLHSLTLANVSLVGTLLQNVSLASLALGSVPLDSVGQSPLAPLPTGVTICGLINCTSGRTLLSAEISPSPLDSVPLDSVPLDSVPLDSVPLDSVSFVKAAAIGALPLDSVPLDSVPLDSVTLGDAYRHLASVPLDSVPLDSVPLDSVRLLDSGLTLCQHLAIYGIGCAGLGVTGQSTLLQLIQAMERHGIDPASSPLDSVPLDSVPLDSVPVLARTLAYFFGDVTLGDVQHRGGSFGGLTLGQLLVAIMDKADYPWEQLPLGELGVTRFAFSGTPVEFELNFTVTGGSAGFITDIVVDLPPQFAYMAGSPSFAGSASLVTTLPAVDPAPPVTLPAVQIPSPAITSGQLHWSLTGIVNGSQNVLHFRANPGLIPAITATTATVTVGADIVATPPIVVTVTEAGEPGNNDPAGAGLTTIAANTLYLTQVSSATDIDYYRVTAPVNPGSRVGVYLSHLGSDADLFVYGPVIANVGQDPRAIPPQGDPLTDQGAGAVANDQPMAPQAPSSTGIASLALRGASANRGSAEESVETLSGSAADSYTIRVAGYNGASSQQPYVLRVKVSPPPATPVCLPRTLKYAGGGVPASSVSPTGGVNTLFIINWKRFGDAYGSTAAASVKTALEALVAANIPHVNAAIVPVDGLPQFTNFDLNPCSADGANAVVKAITGVIAEWRALNPNLANVVIVGSDELIPMARVPDVTRLSNERDYASTFADRQGAIWGAFLTANVLTDDPYGDFDPIPWLNRYLYVPDAAVGRLVETPTEIQAALDLFVARGGFLDPKSGLSTGYDFLTDGATDIQAVLAAQPWATTNGGTGATSLIGETWTADQLSGSLIPASGPPGVISLNSHFNHYQALPADQNAVIQTAAARPTGGTPDPALLFNSDRLIGPTVDTALLGRIIFSMGCHAGLSVIQALFDTGTDDPGRDLASVLEPRAKDWPEVFARQGAIFIGNTGYGYGDTASVALSEKLMLGFAKNLDGKVTLGEALWRAKQTYFSQLGLYGVYDEKALMEATFYGLPMYRIGTLTSPPPPPQLPAPAVEPVSSLLAVPVTINPTFVEKTSPGLRGRFLEASTGSTYTPQGDPGHSPEGGTQVTHYRPIEPRLSFDVTQQSDLAHGVLITALTSADIPGFDPVFSIPVIDMADGAPEPKFESSAFPSSFQNITTYTSRDGSPGARADGLRQNAVIIPGQYFANTSGPGTQRKFTALGTLVYYAPNAGNDFLAPAFARTEALLVGGQVSITVEVTDDLPGAPGAGTGTVRRVLALVSNGSGTWLSVELHHDGGTRWSAVAGVSGANIEYFVQAVDASGNISTSINKGANFPAPAPQQSPPPPDGPIVTLTPHGDLSGGAYASAVRVTVAGPSTYRYSVDDSPFAPVGPAMEFTVGSSGPHTVRVEGADGSEASLQFVIGPAAPSITLVSPKDGAHYATGMPKKASYTCGGGLQITSCVGTVASGARIDTASPGDKSFTVSATDAAGRTAQVTVTYHVMDACLIPPTIPGTPGSETLNGTPGDDVINGMGGNDKINGNGGDDIICAGNGNDHITTGGGDDFIVAGGGNNKVVAGAGDNVISAGDGNDSITSGSGADIITAGAGNNSVIAGDGDNSVAVGPGNDLITTGSGNDTITAGEGNNDVNAGDGNNTVTAGPGNDQVTTGGGNDTIDVGAGNNKVSAGAGNDAITAGAGNDKIDGGPGTDTCTPGGGNNTVTNCP